MRLQSVLGGVALGTALGGCSLLVPVDDYATGAGGSTSAATGASTAAGGTGGGERCGGTQLLADDFSGDLNDLWDLERTGAATTTKDAEEAVARLPTAAGAAASALFRSLHLYDLRQDGVRVEVAATTSTSTAATTFLKVVRTDGSDEIAITERQGKLLFTATRSGSALAGETRTYDPALHRWWRIREEGGTVSAETSKDGSSFAAAATWSAEDLFALDGIHVVLGASTEGDDDAPGEAHFDAVNGGVPAGKWCPMGALTDDFDDGMQNLAWSRSFVDDGCTKTETGGQLVVDVTGQTVNGCGYRSARSYDLTGTTATLEVPVIDPTSALGAYFRMEIGFTDTVAFMALKGNLHANIQQGDLPANAYQEPFDPVKHRWWRFREQSGALIWETSRDGQTWDAFYQESPSPFAFDALDVSFRGASVSPFDESGEIRFDNYNLPP